MRLIVLTLLICLLSTGAVCGQVSAQDKAAFRTQVLSKLRGIGTESANKIAFDFQNAWDGKFTSAQQDKVYQIANEMQRKGYRFYPYFYHFYTYLAYSVAQENLQQQELTNVLEINEQVLQRLNKSQYKEFLFGLNIYFARRFFSIDKTLMVRAPEGSYAFKLLDEYVAIAEEPEEEVVEEEEVEEPIEEEVPDDAWANDSWGSDDSWSTDDSWGSSDDTWGNDDSWGSNDSWGDDSWGSEEPKKEAAPVEVKPDYSPLTADYLSMRQDQYLQPELEGPVIEVKNTNIVMATPYDSLRITSVSGTFLLQDRTIVASQGTVKWPGQNDKFRGAEVQLNDFHIKKDRSDFWTPHAKLTLDGLTSGSVPGVFEYKSVARPPRALSKYPIFTSNRADVTVNLPDENLSYTGGIELRGNKLYGKSVSRKKGVLKIVDDKGNTVILRSKEFILGDTLVSMTSGSATILHKGDSIYHNAVRAKYNTDTRQLMVLRNNSTKAFKSSYYALSMHVDLLTWDMQTDSISMKLTQAKDLLPATFESDKFFDQVRFEKMARFLDFHPISASVYYARKYGVEEFYAGELALEYGIDERFAKGAGKLLSQYNFATYDPATGRIRLNEKAFLYYDASAQRVDYDNFMVPSKVTGGSNAHISLDSGQLKVQGVRRFYITPDFKIYAEPRDSVVTIYQGKNLKFDGMIHAGDFQYKGAGHEFDYTAFLFNMPQIDSMRLTVPLKDTTNQEADFELKSIQNEISETSGTLYINDPTNKAGNTELEDYPYFTSTSDAVVYFDGKEILDGAYDKSVKFIIPPFELDSLERDNGETIELPGTFNSGDIFPTFDETLRVQNDQSLGFRHQIPPEGYNLYGTEAKTYEEIRLSNQGMRGYGQIDFLKATIYSDDFIYYPDSVTTDGTGGVISPGTYKGASFPEAILSTYDMYWLPKKDSMYLRTVDEPFKFYNATAELEGYANITTQGVYGGGTMLTRGSKAVSNELNFQELQYGARHAQFEVLTEDPEKPAMKGDDIRLDFDITQNTATIKPEEVGVASISFPYSQMNTSITEAVWDLEDSIVTMTKPADIDIRDSYFYTTREDLDSLAFNAEKAIYDINKKELNIQGIPYIIVADSKIIPAGNETTILANSVLQEFNDSEIIIDTLNGYHYLNRASIKIFSRNKFEGNAYYQQVVENDTFDIRFDSFELQFADVGEPNRKGVYQKKQMTVSGGEVPESQKLIISPGFYYKGSVTMYASRPALELDGALKLQISDSPDDAWLNYQRTDEKKEVHLPFDNATFETGERAYAGIYSDLRDEPYALFAEKKQNSTDPEFFTASGELSFDADTRTYRIEAPEKTAGTSYAGSTMLYQDSTQAIIFEGKVNLLSTSNTQLAFEASVLGVGSKETNEYSMDAMMSLEFPSAPNGSFDMMGEDLIDIIERIGPPTANAMTGELLYKLANLTSHDIAKKYEEQNQKEYTPLVDASKALEKQLLISGVKMKWDRKEKAWHNTTKLAISNIYREDINAKLDGFLEIKKDQSGAEIVTLFIQAAPGIWYYIGYTLNQLILFSSNPDFNQLITSKSNVENAKPDEMVVAIGSQNETLSFINDFRKKYFGVNEPYNLVSPTDVNLEDEDFDTIEEDEEEDDGFGF